MEDKLITEIQARMAQQLSQGQTEELRRVLTFCLRGVEIAEKKSSEGQCGGDWSLLDVFISAKKIEGCSPKSLKYYDMIIRKMLVRVDKPVQEVSTADLRLYIAEYQEKHNVKHVTIDNIRRVFSSFFSWLEDEGYIQKSPVRRIRRIKADKTVKEVFSDEELEIARDTCNDLRDLAMIDLLATTGMRVGELVTLDRRDIDYQEREFVVVGKGSHERKVYFDARTKIHLQAYLKSRTDDNPALFVTLAPPHERLTISGVETRLHQIGTRANIANVHPHKFRRTLATHAIDKGMPIEQVQKLLGHVRIDTTLQYAMVSQTNVKNSHRKYIC